MKEKKKKVFKKKSGTAFQKNMKVERGKNASSSNSNFLPTHGLSAPPKSYTKDFTLRPESFETSFKALLLKLSTVLRQSICLDEFTADDPLDYFYTQNSMQT